MARIIESDICIIGAGITAAMVAEKLGDERDATVTVVEAGGHTTPFEKRVEARRRDLAYGENPWVDDHIPDQTARGIMSRSMTVGGLAMHWGGSTPRFSPEDFRVKSLYGIGDDWPISYDDLEPFYQEAEERIGISGKQGPPELDPRSKPYPMPPLPLSYNLQQLAEWGERSGIPYWQNPVAKTSVPYRGRNACSRCDTCQICPMGAKYSPDFTYNQLLEQGRIELLTKTLVRRLMLEEGSNRIAYAVAVDRDRPEEPVELRAKTFVLASGYTWSPHLLLLSATDRYPQGLANSSGLVGKYLTGHRPVSVQVKVPFELFPGMYSRDSLLSKQYMRPGKLDRYVRHDLRIWESEYQREPRLRDEGGQVMLGDEILEDWRSRTRTGVARMRAYYDVLPARTSELTLDPQARNRWGDPLPRLVFRDAPESLALRDHTESEIRGVFEEIVRAGGGKILRHGVQDIHDHPGGTCRMGDDPATSVVDRFGRTHDHENLFVVGAPTIVTGGCANATLTFSALSLLAATEIGRAYPTRHNTSAAE